VLTVVPPLAITLRVMLKRLLLWAKTLTQMKTNRIGRVVLTFLR
jgi:hypothetical protein